MTGAPTGLSARLAWLCTGLLICALWAWYLHLIPSAGFHFYDEFHTLDRTTAFSRHRDWFTVYSYQEPSFRKPPLQYWMGAGLIARGSDLHLALYLPSMLFALAALCASALLAAAIAPHQPWAMPGTVLLVAGSAMFWDHALSAMLDMGVIATATAALAAAILALRRPGWWYVSGIAIALGAQQKAPVGLAVVGIFLLFLSLTRHHHGYSFRVLRAQRSFRIATWIAIAGTLAWPVLQAVQYGPGAFEDYFGKQMLQRFTPTDKLDEVRSPGDLQRLLIGGEPLLRWTGILALVWLPWRLRRPELLPLPMVFGLYVLIVTLSGGHITPRYTLVFVPLLAAAFASVAASVLPRGWPAVIVTAALTLPGGGPFKMADRLGVARLPEYDRQIEILSDLGAAMRPEETLVICATPGSDGRVIPGVASFFASQGRPFIQIRDDGTGLPEKLGSDAPIMPLRGICSESGIAPLEPLFSGFQVERTWNGWAIWTGTGVAR